MQVQHDPRARPRAPRRARASRTSASMLCACTTRAPVRRTASATSLGAQPAARAARAPPSRGPTVGRIALEHLDVLAQVLADQPREILDRPLLAARVAVAVVEQQDHGRQGYAPNLCARDGPARLDLLPHARPARLPRGRARLGRPAGGGARRRDRRRRGRRRGRRRRAALAERHGARYVALGAPRGHQRRAQRRASPQSTRRPRSASSTTTSRSGPGWLDALLAAARPRPRGARRADPRRGSRARACARAGASRCRSPRSTSARRTATPSSCGARTWRCGGRALERIGPFDERARRRGRRGGLAAAAARGRRAASATSPRRASTTGAPAATRALRALSRGAYHRGRAARRYDVFKGAEPSPRGRAAHARRLRLAHRAPPLRRRDRAHRAHARAARRDARPAPAPPSATDPDFLSGRSGTLGRRTALIGALRDLRAASAGLRGRAPLRAPRGAARGGACTSSASRAPSTCATVARLRRELDALAPRRRAAPRRARPRRGQVGERQRRARRRAAGDADWLLIVDDDVVLPRGFLDRFLALAEALRASSSRSPRTRSPRTPRGTSRAAAPACSPAARGSSRSAR